MAYTIIKKTVLVDTDNVKIVKMSIEAALIAKHAHAGQFVVVMAEEQGERIPLTIVESDLQSGTVTIIFQEIGFTTKSLGRLAQGQSLFALTGPLGNATDIKKYGNVLVVAGGVGIAEVYPVVREFKRAGNHVTTIIGAKTKKILILEQELKEFSDSMFVTTDDGSYGQKGFVTDVLEQLLIQDPRNGAFDLVYVVGPIPMMARVSKITKRHNLPTLASLNALMVDGTGMCGCCRVTVNSQVKFSCVDGPEFEAAVIDWEELSRRNAMYVDKEKHACRLK
jgi:ferredoxin/flavodoxin---NADP+ reductase